MAYPDSRDWQTGCDEKWTPLSLALGQHRFCHAKLLLKAGADLELSMQSYHGHYSAERMCRVMSETPVDVLKAFFDAAPGWTHLLCMVACSQTTSHFIRHLLVSNLF